MTLWNIVHAPLPLQVFLTIVESTKTLSAHFCACNPPRRIGRAHLVTLIAALRARGLKRGVASLCIGGGEATAMAIEAA